MDGQRWTLRLKLFNQICWQVCIYCWQLLIFAVNKNQVVSQAMYFLLPKKKVIKEGTHWFASTSTFFWMELVHIGFTSLCLDYVLVLVSPKIDLISVGKASSSIVPPISLLDVYLPLKISKWSEDWRKISICLDQKITMEDDLCQVPSVVFLWCRLQV
jgi:hypothetical protein